MDRIRNTADFVCTELDKGIQNITGTVFSFVHRHQNWRLEYEILPEVQDCLD